MGTPLLVVGSSAGRLLPRAGAWMDSVKQVFGVIMLGMAAWMLTRIVPERYVLTLYAVVALALAAVLWRMAQVARGGRALPAFARSSAVLAALYGAALLYGTTTGATDPLDPLAGKPAVTAAASVLPFRPIASVADLDREVSAASAAHQPVMLDFYADWCVSCKEMERDTFSRPEVRTALAHVRLLRADVTANSADDQQLLQRFQIYGPPTIAFYDSQGQERREFRVVGYMKADDFIAQLGQLP
jgi:thiol:disulfide interchange protein DsbD